MAAKKKLKTEKTQSSSESEEKKSSGEDVKKRGDRPTVENSAVTSPESQIPPQKDKTNVGQVDERRSEARERYFEAVGRRKTSVARVRLFTKGGDFIVNNKLYTEYFPTLELQKIAEDSLKKMKLFGRFKVTVKVTGGGIHSQSEALRHGLARALVKFNPDFRKRLKRAGFLRRDPRMKERKKFGLKKARRAPQWSKR